MFHRRHQYTFVCFCLLNIGISTCSGQSDSSPASTAPDSTRQVLGAASPILTGALGYVSEFSPNDQLIYPKFEPVLLLPLGNRFLIETEYSMGLPVERSGGQLGSAVLDHGFEYLQLDYAVSNNLTVVGGRFVTPFGIYKERYDPQWIKNLQTVPLLFALNDNSSNGGMARGSFFIGQGVKLNYAGYYSLSTANKRFEADQASGGRMSLYFVRQRLEVGASYSRKIGDRYNMAGGDLSWSPRRTPIDVRAEYAWTALVGKGYWAEAGYRLSNVGRSKFFRSSQFVARDEHYFVAPGQTINPDLPTDNTHRVTFGYNCWIKDSVKLAMAYGHSWAAGADSPLWSVGVVYRFAFGRGE